MNEQPIKATCPDCGLTPEIEDQDPDRYVCVNDRCRRNLVSILRSHWSETITDAEIEEARENTEW